LQSATDAMKKGEKEELILACLLHDVVLNLIKVDHGWWGAQMMEPYVSEKISWGIRYHQALRFYPDASVGYEYPEQYNQIFGKDYVPPPYVKQAYEYARNHKSYMDARMITVHDLYAFDPAMKVSIDPFVDIIGRHFKQPKEGLGYDNSPVAHMWRTLIFPDTPL
jgi:predicted HD phosphohydrolase